MAAYLCGESVNIIGIWSKSLDQSVNRKLSLVSFISVVFVHGHDQELGTCPHATMYVDISG